MRTTTILLALFLPLAAAAQTDECYRILYDRGVAEYNAGNWDNAIKKWKAAKTCPDKPAKNDLDSRIRQAEQKKPKPPTPTPKPETQAERERKQREADKRAADKADNDTWAIIKDSKDTATFKRYLDLCKSCLHADAARKRIRELTPKPAQTETKPTTKPTTTTAEPDMLPIPAGAFPMGSTEYEGEEPVRTVSVSAFHLARYETTNAQFCAFLNEKGNQTEGGTEWINLSGSYQDEKCRIYLSGQTYRVQGGYENHPVIYVSWYGAKAYCDWLSAKTGRRYRLPTEAEWEYAAGGGSTGRTKWAGTDSESALAQYANFCDSRCKESWADKNQTDGYAYTAPVGSLKPNRLGLYDMSGNVWEWCTDWYGAYPAAAQTNPTGPTTGSLRVGRGGSWNNDARYCRVSRRNYWGPDDRTFDLGFRVASSP